jgi:hypothetical protein
VYLEMTEKLDLMVENLSNCKKWYRFEGCYGEKMNTFYLLFDQK